jgi:signal transduction histidine kinase
MNSSGINANASVVRPSRMSVGLSQLLRYGLAVLSIGAVVGTLLLFEHVGWRPPTGMLMLTAIALNSWYIDPDQVRVTVEDSGMGIDPNAKQKIFEPFYATKPSGMGMGLAISRSILQRHSGGGLWFTARCGRGASFCFTVPRYDQEESNGGV